MSVTLTRKFWNGSQYDDISKVVFTSTNIDSPAVAGTRSHVLPGSPYVGTWYEAIDLQYRQKVNQDPPDTKECLFNQLHLYQEEFTFGTTASGIFLSKYPITNNDTIYYDAINNADISHIANLSSVTVSGIWFRRYDIDFASANGTATVSGSHYYFGTTPTVSGSNTVPGAMYIWQTGTTNSGVWVTPQNSVIFEAGQGEAYNCRLTAWDDATHSTTTNRILQEKKYKVTCCVYKAGGGTKQEPLPDQTVDSMAHPPGIDVSLSGDISYYGDFDLIHIANGGETGLQSGEYFYFTPRLDDINETYESGNYDFVTTFHYQYT